MNQSQFTSFLKTSLGALGGSLLTYAVSHGINVPAVLVGPEAISFYVGLNALVAPYIWGWLAHTPLGNALTATETLGVTVKVGPDAPVELKAAAADPTIPKITKEYP